MRRSLTSLNLYLMLYLHILHTKWLTEVQYILTYHIYTAGDLTGSRDSTKISQEKVCSSEIFVPSRLSVPGSPRMPMPLQPYLCALYVPLLRLNLRPLFALHLKLMELTVALTTTSKSASKKSADGIHTPVIGMQKSAS